MPGGKDIRKIQKQVAEAEKREESSLQTPSLTFATSLYGKEKQPRGRGVGKGGQKKGQPRKDSRPVQEREGWQDPQVLRALHGDPPPGTRTQEEDSDAVVPLGGRQKCMEVEQQVPEKSKMIHTKEEEAAPEQASSKSIKSGEQNEESQERGKCKGSCTPYKFWNWLERNQKVSEKL